MYGHKYDGLSEPSPLILKSIGLLRSSCYTTTYCKIKKLLLRLQLTNPGPPAKSPDASSSQSSLDSKCPWTCGKIHYRSVSEKKLLFATRVGGHSSIRSSALHLTRVTVSIVISYAYKLQL